MSTLVTPARGIATPQGFRLAVPAPPPLLDEKAEAAATFARIGDYLDGIEIAYNDILVAKYIPEKIGSLLTGEPTQKEQRWQNKCGLVLKYGPTAKDDGFKYDTGDWVYYRPSDGQELGFKCRHDTKIVLCLILSPAHIIGKIANPDLIW